MKRITSLISIVVVLVFTGCGPSTAKKNSLIEYGKNNVITIQQFHKSFPNATSHIAYYGGIGSSLSWGSSVVFKGRYIIKMFFDIEVDGKTFTKESDAFFQIMEVTGITKSESGGISMSFSNQQMSFGEAEWEAIYENGLDFSKISYEFENTTPIEGLADVVASSLKNN